MPILAITANSTLQYGGSVDSTVTSATFDDIYISTNNAAYPFYGDSPTVLDLGGGSGGGDIAHALFRTAAINANVPSGSIINSAILRFYYTLAFTNYEVNSHSILRSWVLEEVSYNEYSSGNSWATAGAGGSGDITLTPEDTQTYSGGGYHEIDVTGIVQAIRDGTSQGIMLRNTAGQDFSRIGRSTGTDAQRVEIIIDYSSTGVSVDSGTIAPGNQVVLATVNLGTITSATLGGETLTIDGTDTDEVTVTIPIGIDLKWGVSTYSLVVGDGTNTATLTNQTLAVPTGWTVIDYAGPAPDYPTTESFHELAFNDIAFTAAVPDQLQYTAISGMTVDGQWIVDVDPPANGSGSWAIYDDSAGTRTAQRSYSITDGTLSGGAAMIKSMVNTMVTDMVTGMAG